MHVAVIASARTCTPLRAIADEGGAAAASYSHEDRVGVHVVQ
jgi:hypothetical protein